MGSDAMQGDYPLIGSKIQVPQRAPTLLRRERLVGFLHSNINHKVVLISAGAGYGKTSLLIDYAHDAELPICWYTLDAGDNHVFTFIEYLIASIRRRFPDFGESVLQALRTFRGPAEDVEPFIRLLLAEIEDNISSYFAIVLDDYHEVLESEPVNALVDGLLRYLPEHCHLIIASRAIPRRLTLTRLAAREEIVGLGVRQLRFTRDEIRQILALRGMSDFPAQSLDVLTARSEGWITAILLAAQTHWTSTIEEIVNLSGSLDNIFAFLAQEVLAQQSEMVQEFLLGTSVLEEMSPPLCDALLDIDNSAQILRGLAEQGLFTFEINSSAGWYQYHQLFREFLVTKLETERPDDYRQLFLKEARIMADQGRWPWAIQGYLSAQAYERAADALEIVAQDYYDVGRRQEIQEWIDALPQEILYEHPRLMVVRAKISTESGNYAAAHSMLVPAYEIYAERGNAVGLAHVLFQQAVVYRMQERIDLAVTHCHRVLETIEEREDPTSFIRAHQNLGICYHMLGDPARGGQEMQRALELAEAHGDGVVAAYIAHDMGTSLHLQGAMEDARRYLHRALMHWRRVGNPADLAMTLQGLGVIHHHQAQYAEAQNRYEESIEKARQSRDPRIEAYALLNNGDLQKDHGRYPEALTLYEEAMDVASSLGQVGLMLYVLASMGDAHRLNKDVARARQALTEALDQGERQAMEEPIGLTHLALGALAIQEDKPERAADHLQQALALLEKAGGRREVARVYLQKALLARHVTDPRALREALVRLGELVQQLGTDQFIIAEGPDATRLLPYISEWSIQGLDAIRIRAQIEEMFPVVTMEPRLRLVQSNLELELLALDASQVIYKGSVVRDFESSVARTMAFLLAQYPAGLARERISDMLWPDSSQARGESLFHSTIYRLRRALDRSAIMQIDGIYRLSPKLSYRYDVAEFERLARLGRGNDETSRIARVNAINLYRNGFLEAHDYAWCHEIRYALQHEMIRLLTIEADCLAMQDELESAETLYLRVLALDEMDERAHRGIMWCRARLGDTSGAMRQFRECSRILEQEMGVPPRPDTRRLFDQIHHGHVPLEPS
jgi:LuxR family transcriptional regulator, maltose regulon positive regulatory protein